MTERPENTPGTVVATAPYIMRTMLGGWVSALLLGPLAFAIGCSSAPDTTTADDDITDVAHTPVKEQTIGNCWLYASVAWAESLHKTAANESLDLSESYLTYWHWYEQLAKFGERETTPELETGGFFHVATHLMTTYGMTSEGGFIEGDDLRAGSARQREALARVTEALKPKPEGSTSPFAGRLARAGERTPKNIRAVLSEAFALSDAVRRDLDDAFGDQAPAPLARDRAVPERIYTPWTFAMTAKAPGQAATVSTLDAVTEQWEEEYTYGGDERSSRRTVRRLQKAMHDAMPALVVWNVDFASSQSDGAFMKRPTSKLDKWDGAHMTVVEDYQAVNVPSYGTLPAGTLITDPATLDAALSDQAGIGFLRIKNSWGFKAGPAGSEDLKGYYDLHADYLFGMRALTSVIVPRAYDDRAPAGQTDVCSTGGRARTSTVCAKTLTGDATDKRVLKCTNGVTTTSRTCEQGCSEQPQGVPDSCVDAGGVPTPPPPNPCKTGGARSSGKYCGASLGLRSSDPGFARVYSCQKDPATNDWISPSAPCSNGCKVQPSGVPDVCR